MANDLYRYRFRENVFIEDVESALLLALWGCENLHGEAQTRLDASHYLDPAARACVIDAGTPVGRDFNRLFTGFIRRSADSGDFEVERVHNSKQEGRDEAAA